MSIWFISLETDTTIKFPEEFKIRNISSFGTCQFCSVTHRLEIYINSYSNAIAKGYTVVFSNKKNEEQIF